MIYSSIDAWCVLVLRVLRPPPRNSAKTKREDGSKRKDVSYLYGDVGSLLSNNTLSRGQGKGPHYLANKGLPTDLFLKHIHSTALLFGGSDNQHGML